VGVQEVGKEAMSQRKGVHCEGACSLDDTPLLVRGDVVSCELADGRSVEFPEDWGLVHDPTGICVNQCEVFVCPYSAKTPLRHRLPPDVADAAHSYWGKGERLLEGFVELPEGPWERVGVIQRLYYDRYGELSSPYQHPFEKGATLYKQRKAQKYHSGRHRAYRISLPDGCVINAHGFVHP